MTSPGQPAIRAFHCIPQPSASIGSGASSSSHKLSREAACYDARPRSPKKEPPAMTCHSEERQRRRILPVRQQPRSFASLRMTIAVLAGLLLTACGGSAAPSAAPSSASAAAKPVSASAAPASAKPAASQAAPASAKPSGAASASASGSGVAVAGNAALQAVYQAAKAEGQVNWNSSSAENIVANTIAAFEKAYPGVKVNYTAKPAPQVLNDVQVQQAAKHVEIDVAQSADLNIVETLDHNVAASADWAKLGVPAERIFQNLLVNYTDSPFIFVYNKDKVAAADVPKTWDDLINPRWNGQMVLDGRGTFLASFIAAPEAGGPSKGLDLAKKLESQKPLYQTSFTVIEPMIISGQAMIGNDSLSNYLAAQKKNAPIDVV